MERFNGVDSEVFRDEADVGEFEQMVEDAKEEERGESGNMLLNKIKELFSKSK